MRAAYRLALAACLVSCIAYGSTLSLGALSFDVLIPSASGSPGVNGFTISNFTGDPLTGGWAIPPDFPVISSLAFVNARVELNDGTSIQTFLFPSFAPGAETPFALQFSSDVQFVSARFIATLSQTSLALSTGDQFQAASSFAADLLPSNGQFLEAGSDFVVLSASEVPEPATLWITGTGLLATFVVVHRRKVKHSRHSSATKQSA